MANGRAGASVDIFQNALASARVETKDKVKRELDEARTGEFSYEDAVRGLAPYSALLTMTEGFAASKKTGEPVVVDGVKVELPPSVTSLAKAVYDVLRMKKVYVRHYLDGDAPVIDFGELKIDLDELTKNNVAGRGSSKELITASARSLIITVNGMAQPPSPASLVTAINQIKTALTLGEGGVAKVDTKVITHDLAPVLSISPHILLARKVGKMKPVIVIGPQEQLSSARQVISTTLSALEEAIGSANAETAVGDLVKNFGPYIGMALDVLAAYGKLPDGDQYEKSKAVLVAFLSTVPKIGEDKIGLRITALVRTNSEAPCADLLKEGKAAEPESTEVNASAMKNIMAQFSGKK